MEASRKRGLFDTRWPCALRHSSSATPAAPPLRAEEAARLGVAVGLSHVQARRQTAPAQLSLVPREPALAPLDQGLEEAGTRRLLAAMAARHAP